MEKTDQGLCWTSYEEENGNGLDACWKIMIVFTGRPW